MVFCLFISLLWCFLLEHDDGFDAPESMYNFPGDGEERLGQVAFENEQVDISSKVQETVSGSIYKIFSLENSLCFMFALMEYLFFRNLTLHLKEKKGKQNRKKPLKNDSESLARFLKFRKF